MRMTRSRTAAVAALAGASFFVVPGTSQAAECGAQARAAVYQNVTIPAIDASYRTEVEWTRPVPDQAAYTDFSWSRRLSEYSYSDYAWVRHVVDVAFEAGRPEVSYTRYEWMREITHVQHLWRYQVIDRPAAWTSVHHDAVTHEEFVWQRTVIDTPHQDAVPEQGHDETRYSRRVVATPETTQQRLVKAAYDEQVVVQAAHTVHHAAVTHVVHHDAEYTTVVTEREYGKWNGRGWTYKWYPASANPQGWILTGKTKTEQQLVKGAYDETVTDKAAYDETVPATYTTVHHDAVYETVVIPATYTTEYLWAPTAPGGAWTTTGGTRRVVTQEAQPEVPEVSHVEKSTYRDTAPDGNGWERTSESTTVVDQPAYDERVRVKATSHWVKQWSEARPDQDHAWVQTKKQRTLPSTVELTDVDGAGTPDGDGWSRSGKTWQVVDEVAVPEVPEQGHDEFGSTTSATTGPWADTTNEGSLTGTTAVHTQDSYVPLAGPYEATGVVRDLDVATQVAWTRDTTTSPDGEGWSLTGEENAHDAVTHAETIWMVSGQMPDDDGWSATGASRPGDLLTPGTPASTVAELVSAAVPAGAPCVQLPAAPPVVATGGTVGGTVDTPARTRTRVPAVTPAFAPTATPTVTRAALPAATPAGVPAEAEAGTGDIVQAAPPAVAAPAASTTAPLEASSVGSTYQLLGLAGLAGLVGLLALAGVRMQRVVRRRG